MKSWKHVPASDSGLSLHESLRSSYRESGLFARISHTATWTILRAYLRHSHKLQIEGSQHLPPHGPFVLVANHSSHLDTITLASALPLSQRSDVVPVAAGDTFFTNVPKSALAAFALNALPMWRKGGGAQTLKILRQRLTNTETIMILFPEGTRSRDGNLAEFKPGIGMIVANTNVPVVPCHLEGCFEALPAGASKPRRGIPIRLRIGPPRNYAHQPNDRHGWSAIATDLQQAVTNLQQANTDLS